LTASTERIDASARALAVAGLVVAADQVTKAAVVDNISRGGKVEVLPFLDLANVRNDGVAFGLGQASAPLIGFTVVILLAILAYLSLGGLGPRFWVSGGLLVGGAVSNLADRVRIGSVIDWIDFPAWPTFNLADVAIVAGVMCLVLLPPGTPPGGAAGAGSGSPRR
jgi:lipoprotein signal peptidase